MRLGKILDYFNVQAYSSEPLPEISYTFEG
jgi:hypothetical protein